MMDGMERLINDMCMNLVDCLHVFVSGIHTNIPCPTIEFPIEDLEFSYASSNLMDLQTGACQS